MSSISIFGPIVSPEAPAWRGVDTGERLAAAILLVVLSPLLFAISVITLILSGRSPLIAHRRVGQYGSELWVLKFRTMWEPRTRPNLRQWLPIEYIDDQLGPRHKKPDDGRIVSRFARLCRRHSLDELPQLVHVLAGRMSLVGPRPVTPSELSELYGPEADCIIRVKPGLAGLWQVSGRNRLSDLERCRLDVEWVQRRSFRLYCWILLRTIPEVVNGSNTW